MNRVKGNLVALMKDGSLVVFDNQEDYRKNHTELMVQDILGIMTTDVLIREFRNLSDADSKLSKIRDII